MRLSSSLCYQRLPVNASTQQTSDIVFLPVVPETTCCRRQTGGWCLSNMESLQMETLTGPMGAGGEPLGSACLGSSYVLLTTTWTKDHAVLFVLKPHLQRASSGSCEHLPNPGPVPLTHSKPFTPCSPSFFLPRFSLFLSGPEGVPCSTADRP